MTQQFYEALREIMAKLYGPDAIWHAAGFLGQIVFTMRFVVQWIASEKQGKSIIPIHFWFFSIAGSLVLLVYSFWLRNPVFVVAQSFGCFVYVRNLTLLAKEKKVTQTQ
jgi:lipid-A-disaccharide synthase-like uncharacterized protein